MADTVEIARCPRHGLHGARACCYQCGGPVDQVPMVEASDIEDLDLEHARELLRWADMYGEPEEWCKKAQALHGKCEDLREALRPFVEAAEKWAEEHDDEWEDGYFAPLEIISDHVVRCRRLLNGAIPGAEADKQSHALVAGLSDLCETYRKVVNRKEAAGEDASYQRGLVAGLMARVSFKRGVKAFLSLTFDLDDIKPFRTKRDARDEAMRIVGFSQAQEQLRHILGQCESQAAAELSAMPRPEGALQPLKIGDRNCVWVPPELPTR